MKIEAKKRHNHFVIHILPRLAKGNSQQAYVSVDVNHLACFPICSIFGSKRQDPIFSDIYQNVPESGFFPLHFQKPAYSADPLI